MTILALDCGNKTGWARSGDRYSGPRESGVQDFTPKAGDLAGVRWSRFNDWLTAMLRGANLVVYERWTASPGMASKIAAGFITRIEERCDALGIARLEVSPAELKRWLTGKGNASKREMLDAVLARRGWTDKTAMSFDEADAIALLHYALEKAG